MVGGRLEPDGGGTRAGQLDAHALDQGEVRMDKGQERREDSELRAGHLRFNPPPPPSLVAAPISMTRMSSAG